MLKYINEEACWVEPIRKPRVAVYAGSFNPPHRGHADILHQARLLFARIYWLKAINPDKAYSDGCDRHDFLYNHGLISSGPEIIIASTVGLVADYAKAVGASHLIRGVRFDNLIEEMQMAISNESLTGIRTILIPSSLANLATSSTLERARRLR